MAIFTNLSNLILVKKFKKRLSLTNDYNNSRINIKFIGQLKIVYHKREKWVVTKVITKDLRHVQSIFSLNKHLFHSKFAEKWIERVLIN